MKKSENQNIEYKESWRDDFLKTICAFANVKGGELHVGIDDKGIVKGLNNCRKLLEDIPSKVKELLGFLPDVISKSQKGKEYLIVKVKSYDTPISYNGKYYLRSGSTTQELNGTDLQQFLLQKSKHTWESIIEDGATMKDIDVATIQAFKLRAKDGISSAFKETSNEHLLTKLHLLINKKVTRAAILLFGKDPQQFHPGTLIKIGRFDANDNLISSDDIGGNLFNQAEKAMELLKTKYLSSNISIKGLYRTELLEYPEAAIREAIINAVAHRDFSKSHVQIKVYQDKLVFWNPGKLPIDLTIEHLKKKHPSHPRNRLIATVLHNAGLIEAWGSGTMKMVKECTKISLPEPIFEEYVGGFQVIFSKDLFTEDRLLKLNLNDRQIKAILHLKEYSVTTNQEYQKLNDIQKRTASRDLTELVEKGIFLKSGVTGKGTTYSLRGHKGVKGDIELLAQNPKNNLDDRLSILDKSLEQFDPEEELQKQFSKELFVEIYDTWLSEFMIEFVTVIQKFNRYFINPSHSISLPNPLGGIRVVNESPQLLIDEMKIQALRNLPNLQIHDSTLNIFTQYGSFRKAGLDTFGCNYSVSIKFTVDWYEVLMDDEIMKRNQKLQIKRQYHKPLLREESRALATKFGDVIYQHITFAIDDINKRNAKGDIKGSKGTNKK